MRKFKASKDDSTVALFFVIFLYLFFIFSWCYNLYEFTQCDFESDYKCEAVHGLGVFVPQTSVVTVFFDTDEDNAKE